MVVLSVLMVCFSYESVSKKDSDIETEVSALNKLDGMRNVFWIGSEGVPGGLGPSRTWSTRDP